MVGGVALSGLAGLAMQGQQEHWQAEQTGLDWRGVDWRQPAGGTRVAHCNAGGCKLRAQVERRAADVIGNGCDAGAAATRPEERPVSKQSRRQSVDPRFRRAKRRAR